MDPTAWPHARVCAFKGSAFIVSNVRQRAQRLMMTTKELNQHVRFVSFLAGSFCLAGSACMGENHLITDDVDKANPSGTADASANGDAVAMATMGADATGLGSVTSLGNGGGGGWPIQLTPVDVARRLSMFLFKAPPSARLTQEVIARNPRTNEDVGAITEALLFDKESSQGVRGFYSWLLKLELDRWARVLGDSRYPDLSRGLLEALIDDALTFGERTTWETPGTFAALMTEPAAYVTALTPQRWFPEGTIPPNRSSQHVKVKLPSNVYAGILSQPAVVAIRDEAPYRSISRRGSFVSAAFLCESSPPPPSFEIVFPQEGYPGATERQRLENATSGAPCSSCHVLMNPLGVLFENFDAVGAFATTENGVTLDASSTVGVPWFPEPQKLAGVPELSKRLAVSPKAWNCFAANWLAYATGLYETGAQAAAQQDNPGISYIVKRATVEGDLNLRGVIRAVTETRAFLQP